MSTHNKQIFFSALVYKAVLVDVSIASISKVFVFLIEHITNEVESDLIPFFIVSGYSYPLFFGFKPIPNKWLPEDNVVVEDILLGC